VLNLQGVVLTLSTPLFTRSPLKDKSLTGLQ
jgi:hypothetical protein